MGSFRFLTINGSSFPSSCLHLPVHKGIEASHAKMGRGERPETNGGFNALKLQKMGLNIPYAPCVVYSIHGARYDIISIKKIAWYSLIFDFSHQHISNHQPDKGYEETMETRRPLVISWFITLTYPDDISAIDVQNL